MPWRSASLNSLYLYNLDCHHSVPWTWHPEVYYLYAFQVCVRNLCLHDCKNKQVSAEITVKFLQWILLYLIQICVIKGYQYFTHSWKILKYSSGLSIMLIKSQCKCGVSWQRLSQRAPLRWHHRTHVDSSITMCTYHIYNYHPVHQISLWERNNHIRNLIITKKKKT
jgi:hypothetical protein